EDSFLQPPAPTAGAPTDKREKIIGRESSTRGKRKGGSCFVDVDARKKSFENDPGSRMCRRRDGNRSPSRRINLRLSDSGAGTSSRAAKFLRRIMAGHEGRKRAGVMRVPISRERDGECHAASRLPYSAGELLRCFRRCRDREPSRHDPCRR